MTSEEIKQYLKQVGKLDKLIENKLIEKMQWQAIATSTTGKMTPDKVQTSGNKQKMEDAVIKCVEIEREIDRYIDELINTKKEVTETIEQLEPIQYDLLHKRYIQGLTLDEIAKKCDKSYTWVTTTHGRALQKVREILGKRKNRYNNNKEVEND